MKATVGAKRDAREEDVVFSWRDVSILLVDGNTNMRALVRGLLYEIGVREVFDASNGGDALERLAEYSVDAVVCAWLMEPVSGMDFLMRLRRDAKNPHRDVPFVMLSEFADAGHVLAARDAGVTEFLIKPVSLANLERHLRIAITAPRPFVEAGRYAGPDRRRRKDQEVAQDRRHTTAEPVAMAPKPAPKQDGGS